MMVYVEDREIEQGGRVREVDGWMEKGRETR